VLILESDDWGAGPLEQAGALEKIDHLLSGFRDQADHPAVMTLGIILEVPDGERIRQADFHAYHGLRLGLPVFDPILTAINSGIASGVYAPQLHGLTHYRPSTLLDIAKTSEQVRVWLAGALPAQNELLPDALQSNWIDAGVLPPLQLSGRELETEVKQACAAYRQLFGQPGVAVATTFIWSDQVENLWAQHGLNTVITPGRRYTSRNAQGQPDSVDAQMYNGKISPTGLLYLVRDVYFEPARGHGSERLEQGVAERTALGRPTLVEIHRCNFLGRAADASLRALSEALRRAMTRWPQVRFLSSAELAVVYRTNDPAWIDNRLGMQILTWARRARRLPRFAKLSRLTGLDWLLKLMGDET
jgi:hypothetical protein